MANLGRLEQDTENHLNKSSKEYQIFAKLKKTHPKFLGQQLNQASPLDLQRFVPIEVEGFLQRLGCRPCFYS